MSAWYDESWGTNASSSTSPSDYALPLTRWMICPHATAMICPHATAKTAMLRNSNQTMAPDHLYCDCICKALRVKSSEHRGDSRKSSHGQTGELHYVRLTDLHQMSPYIQRSHGLAGHPCVQPTHNKELGVNNVTLNMVNINAMSPFYCQNNTCLTFSFITTRQNSSSGNLQVGHTLIQAFWSLK